MRRIDNDFPSQVSVRETLEEMRTLFKLGNQLVITNMSFMQDKNGKTMVERLDKSSKLEANVTNLRPM